MHVNIRSLEKNLYKINNLLVRYNIKPDIIAISETWLQSSSYFNPDLTGYTYINGVLDKKAGGVGLFISKHLQYKIIKHFSLSLESVEELWIEIINPTGANFLVSVVYRHPFPQEILQFQDKFERCIYELNKLKRNYFILGDININFLSRKINNFTNNLQSLGCRQLVNFITHPNPKNSTILDHIYTNCDDHKTSAYYLKEDLSDYFPIFLLVEKFKIKKENNRIQYRDMKNFSPEVLNERLYNNLLIFDDHYLNTTDTNTLFNKFLTIFKSTIDDIAPIKTLSKRASRL